VSGVRRYIQEKTHSLTHRYCIDGCRWRKYGYPAFKAAYNPKMISAFQDLVRTEGLFLQSVFEINEAYIRPILNTPDKQLREQTQDLADVFISLKNIEALHRYVLHTLSVSLSRAQNSLTHTNN